MTEPAVRYAGPCAETCAGPCTGPCAGASSGSKAGVGEHLAEQFLVAVGQRRDEPREHRLAVVLPIENAGHPPGGEAGLVGDGGVPVDAPVLVPAEQALGV